MTTHARHNWVRRLKWAGLFIVSLFIVSLSGTPSRAENERVITVFHDGIEQTIVTDAQTVGEALERAKVTLNESDTVEPARATKLEAPAYSVNVYRARPVTVVDGPQRSVVMTSHTSAGKIAEAAGVTLYNEDEYTLDRIDDFVTEGSVGLKMTIDRATLMRLVLYGTPTEIRTQATTVGELMAEKKIHLAGEDGTNLSPETPITSGLSLEVWRNGVQTATVEEEVNFATKQVRDVDKPVGYREVQTAGVKGKKMVTYQIEMKNGQEVSRTLIQSVTTQEPKEQVEVIGAKASGSPLSKAKGVNMFVDSKGVTHRETYYDLPMAAVMRNCGAGGNYSVRSDGAKVDAGGYVIIAANLANYPRCSVVETSLGLGKVYDTGGFASVHPHGFDLATDWSNNNGQ
jgi:uncharacterized protein YabE (DUF348 family)